MTFLDIGANIGYFSLLAAAAIGSSGRVVAFEPTPTVASRLRENILLNRFTNVTVVEAAVSGRDGHAQLSQSTEDPEANSLFGPAGEGMVKVATVSLDDELLRRKITGVDVIKIDAEGSELEVLKGARRLLTTERPAIVLELNPLALESGGTTPDEVLSQLKEYGYRWEEIEGALWNGVQVTNILATAPPR
jgi:FkbM family methyltransferase